MRGTDRAAGGRAALLGARDVAEVLGCSEWWVKEQARNRRIPFAWIGGSYRFTDEHVAEIIRRCEVLPDSPVPAPAVVPAAVPVRAPAVPLASVRSPADLTARVPRRARAAERRRAAA